MPRAPVPKPIGYAVKDFELCNSSIEGGDGLGQEQERVRRFTFGVRGTAAPNLLRWIPRAALRLPKISPTVAYDDGPGTRDRLRRSAVLADDRAVPVAVGGSGKPERVRVPPLTDENGVKHETPRLRQSPVCNDHVAEHRPERLRQPTITGANPTDRRPKGGHGERRTIAEMLHLQGLPEDLLDEAPFTAKAKRRLIANGVPMPMGRAVAAAVVKALGQLATDRGAPADSRGTSQSTPALRRGA